MPRRRQRLRPAKRLTVISKRTLWDAEALSRAVALFVLQRLQADDVEPPIDGEADGAAS